MSEDQKVTTEQLAEVLKEIGPNEDGRYNFHSRKPPEGYTTLREVWQHADVHPSWLRSLVSKGKFAQYDEPGVPAVLQNIRGVWAVRISAVKAYEAGKREKAAPGEGKAGYKYEPMALKTTKRTLNECRKRSAPAAVTEYLEGLVKTLEQEWADGKIGKEAKAEDGPEAEGSTDEGEAAETPEVPMEEDFDFDFEDEDN
jgi:hypothetical protein